MIKPINRPTTNTTAGTYQGIPLVTDCHTLLNPNGA